MTSLTDDLCSAVAIELRRRAGMLDGARGSIIKVAITVNLDAESGAIRTVAVEDLRLYKRRGTDI